MKAKKPNLFLEYNRKVNNGTYGSDHFLIL